MTLSNLTKLHRFQNSCEWRLTPDGIEVNGKIPRTEGPPATARKIWRENTAAITKAANRYAIPVELIIACAAAESGGNPGALRKEPGYASDETTPNKISPGIMQTLISTARSATGNKSLSRTDLLNAATSIDAGTAYMALQRSKTDIDPPLVAAAYNAGGVYLEDAPANRWKMRCYPLGTGRHIDRFIEFLNDAMAMLDEDGITPQTSFRAMLLNGPQPAPPPLPPAPEPPAKKTWAEALADFWRSLWS